MGILLISIIIFILIFASGYVGLHVQKRLADEHKTGESRGVVGQVAGLLTLLLALVLGTLIGVSFALFLDPKTELEAFSAQISCGSIRRSRGIWARDKASARQAQGGNCQGL